MASSILMRVGAGVVVGGAGILATTSGTGHAQQAPAPRRQPEPRVQNAPSIAGVSRTPTEPWKSQKTMQVEAGAKAEEARQAGERAKVEAETRRIEAETRAKELDAATKAREIEAATKAREAEEKRKSDEAARAADAEKAKLDREREKDSTGMLTTGLAIAAGVAALVAGVRGGGALARGAATAAKETVKAVSALGRDAAAINKASGVVTGTPAGDALRGIVTEANKLGRTTQFASLGKSAAGEKLATGLKVLGTTEVVASYALPAAAPALGLSQESADRASSLLRITGAAAVGGGFGMKVGLTSAKPVRPPARALASINAGANRLAREAKGGAAKLSTNNVQAAIAESGGKLKVAKAKARVKGNTADVEAIKSTGRVRKARTDAAPASAAPAPAPAAKPPRARRASSPRTRSSGGTYERRYTRGPKAGMTEIVRKPD